MIGRTLAHYRITEALGAGGMGEVYRATDTKLGREVALKVLPADLAASANRLERFEREARALAALDHPGIVTVYSVETADGVHFLTMRLVEGASLAERIPEGGLPEGEILSIATQLADALGAAHDRGIVHRDLKPGNVMVGSSGRVTVLDFGLAKVVASASAPDEATRTRTLTREGVAPGTVPYMAPEQVAGRPVDHRADLHALGAIVYEMAAGRRPFTALSDAELISSILRDRPTPLGQIRADLSPQLVALVDRCLAKDPGHRPQTAREVRRELEALRRGTSADTSAPSSGAARRLRESEAALSIAVLPFTDMSPARDHDWFCEGIAEEILIALARLPDLRVATRTSAFRYKDPARDLRAIGETLGVTTLLEGSVRTAGTRLRVTAQLVNAADGYQLWSDRFDRQMDDVFEIQDEIARRVVGALKPHLAPPSGPLHEPGHSADVEAYQLFLKGRHLRLTNLDLKGALAAFEQAVARDPGYALARVAAAETLTILLTDAAVPARENIARARDELKRARELSGETADVLAAEAHLALDHDADMPKALAAFERALALDPNHVPARAWYAWALVIAGRDDEAIAQARRAIDLDPLAPYPVAMAGGVYLFAGHGEEAIALERKALSLGSDSVLAMWMLGITLAAAQRWDEATEWFTRAVETSGRSPNLVGMLGWCHAASGNRAAAQEILAELTRRSATEYVSPVHLVCIVAELGDMDRARALLAEVFAERCGFLLMQPAPMFRKLRGERLMREREERLRGGGGREG